MPAPEVRAGDLIVASLATWPTPYRVTRATAWVTAPYSAEPAPWDPTCRCESCPDVLDICGPADDRIVMARDETGRCDVGASDDHTLIIPAASLLLPSPP